MSNTNEVTKVSQARVSVGLSALKGQSVVTFMLNEEKTWAAFLLSDGTYHWLECEQGCCTFHEVTTLSGVENLCRGEVLQVWEQVVTNASGYDVGCFYTIVTPKGNCTIEVHEFDRDACYGADELNYKQPKPYEMTVAEEDFC